MPRGPSWKPEEEQKILEAVANAQKERKPLSIVWGELAQQLPGRSPSAISMHYYQMIAKNGGTKARASETATATVTTEPKRRGRKPKNTVAVTIAEDERKATITLVDEATDEAEAEDTATAEQTVIPAAVDDAGDEWEPVSADAEAGAEEVEEDEETMETVEAEDTDEADEEVAEPMPLLALGAQRAAAVTVEAQEVSEDEDEDTEDTDWDLTPVLDRLSEIEASLNRINSTEFFVRGMMQALQAAANATLSTKETTSLREQIQQKDKQLSLCMNKLNEIRTATKEFKDYFEAFQNLPTIEQMGKYAEFLQRVNRLVATILG